MKNLLMSVLAVTILVATAEARRDQHREQNQQNRIQQGVQSGALTKKETKKLRKGQKHIDRLQAKAKADGVISPEEKMRIEKAQDRQSKLIYKQKHDAQNRNDNSGSGQVAPPVAAPETK